MTGTIVRITGQKGYGFIRGEDKVEYFFHKQDVNGFFDDMAEDIEKGQKVEVTFDSVPSQKGPRAANVTRMD